VNIFVTVNRPRLVLESCVVVTGWDLAEENVNRYRLAARFAPTVQRHRRRGLPRVWL